MSHRLIILQFGQTVTYSIQGYWNDQEVKYNWKADIHGTGSRSNV